MHKHSSLAAWFAGGALMVGGLVAQDPPKPDNTKSNQTDRAKTAVTADKQKNDVNDRDMTKKIRQAVMADKSLSTYAHNIKIVSRDGMVTLKGPVRSEDEKKAIEAKAVEVAGSADKVQDQLSVSEKAK
jgi:hyperosmotically inducible protein